MAETKRYPVTGFKGLNNVTDPLRLSPQFQTTVDNVDVTDDGMIVRARGFAQSTTHFAITGAYATEDFKRFYLVDQGELQQIHSDLTHTALATGLSTAHTSFAEVNGLVFYANGVDHGVIEPDGLVRTWGIARPAAPTLELGTGMLKAGEYRVACTLVDAQGMESGNGDVAAITATDDSQIIISNVPSRSGYTTNVYVTARDGTVFFLLKAGAGSAVSYNCGPDELGMELPYWMKDGPRGTLPAYFGGRMYLAEPYPELDLTAIWPSMPLQYHHFDYAQDGLLVPGIVRMLRACADALIIGTDRAVHAWNGEKLTQVADYGVVAGEHADRDGDQLYFWTLRGLAKALPFVNLSERLFSVAPGIAAAATVMKRDGMRRYLVALQKGGSAFNPRS